ncbi:MAG: glucuronate isomerase [Bacteroidia bacterium]|nr:glucuronate isomerase [Bacteroidia bacterium]
MKAFVHDNFLLQSDMAEQLYHETAKDLPVIDYHNHVDPTQLIANYHFQNIARLWVNQDPYKHRAMRINGIPEAEITGPASDKAKFLNWAKTLPKTLGNPLFHWSCLELKRVLILMKYSTRKAPRQSGKRATKSWSRANYPPLLY